MRSALRIIASLGWLAATVFSPQLMAEDLLPDGTFRHSPFEPGASYRYTSGSSDEALRIFPSIQSNCDESGCFGTRIYYVAGRTQSAGSTKWLPAILVLDQDGEPLAGVGANGWLVSPANLDNVNDAAYDPAQGHMYFVGTDYAQAAAVICMDVNTGNLCSGFGIAGGGMTTLRFGDGYNNLGDRILFDEELGLIVSGRAWLAEGGDGDWVGVARLSATTGERLPEFSTDGRRLYSNSPRLVAANGMNVNAMALAPTNDSSGRRHLYIGGNYRRDVDVYDSFDGFVVALSAENGNGIGNFGGPGTAWLTVKNEYPILDNKKDSVTALAVLANSKLAVLGWAERQYGGGSRQRYMMFARFGSDGTRDTGFCSSEWPFGGSNNACIYVGPYAWDAADSRYAGILERPDNRDAIYVFTRRNDQNIQFQTAIQSSASANTDHGTGVYYWQEYPPLSSTFRAAAWDGIGNDRIVMAGSRQRSDSIRWEFTVTRVWDDDTIFGDTFGGPNGD